MKARAVELVVLVTVRRRPLRRFGVGPALAEDHADASPLGRLDSCSSGERPGAHQVASRVPNRGC